MISNTGERLSKHGIYPLAGAGTISDVHGRNRTVAKWTGQKRPPRKGEYYLSGVVIEAYEAPNDLAQPYAIAELFTMPPPPDVMNAAANLIENWLTVHVYDVSNGDDPSRDPANELIRNLRFLAKGK